MSKVKVVVVGLGWVGQNRHLKTIKKSSGFEICGLIDRNQKILEQVSHQYGVKNYKCADNLDGVSWVHQADLVVISTPPDSHFSIVMQALSLKKHVLVEKPFASSREEAQEMVNYAESCGCTLMIVHNFQFSSSYMKAERDLRLGRLGKVKSVIARQFGNPKRRLPKWYEACALGLFYDESPHLLYLIDRLTQGTVKVLRSRTFESTTGYQTPALVDSLLLGNIDGEEVPITLHMSFESPLSEWHFVIMGENGAAVVDLFRDIYCFVPNDKRHAPIDILRTSLEVTMRHWLGVISRGFAFGTGNLFYGNDKVYQLVQGAIQANIKPKGITSRDAQRVLNLQWDIISSACIFNRNS